MFKSEDHMDQIFVDDSFTSQLPAAQGPCLVFDSKGKPLGCFTPTVDASLYRGIVPSVSKEELDRREKAGGGRSLASILSDLQRRP
jgi:hypothetical protein